MQISSNKVRLTIQKSTLEEIADIEAVRYIHMVHHPVPN